MKRLVLVLLTMICLATTVSSQNISPQLLFQGCDIYCFKFPRLGANGNIFVYYEAAFYEIDSATSVVTKYDIGTYFRPTGELFDFVVLANYKIIVAESYLDFKLTLIDLQTNSAIELTHNMSGLFVCGGIMGGPFDNLRNIFLVDESHILLCSENHRGAYFNLAHLENNSLVLEQQFRFGAYGEVAAYPASWFTVLAGLDGNAYVVSSTIYSQRSSGSEILDYNRFAVEFYNPVSQAWSEQIVDLPNNPTDDFIRNVELVAVDELGNLYFLEDIRNRNYTYAHSKLMMFAPDGRIIWELTDADLGGIFDNVVISDSGHATIFFRDNSFLPIDLSEIAESL